MTAPNKSIYSGNYIQDKKTINGGNKMEKLKFDTETGRIVSKKVEQQYKEVDQVGLALALIAIVVAVCLLVPLF